MDEIAECHHLLLNRVPLLQPRDQLARTSQEIDRGHELALSSRLDLHRGWLDTE